MSDSIDGVDIVRIQKRLVHLCAQAVELGFAGNHVPLSTRPPAVQDNDTNASPDNWATSKTRTEGAQELRVELIRRFMTKSTGFVAGIKHQENADLVGLGPGMANNDSGAQAAAQMSTAYFCRGSEALMTKLSKQDYKHLSVHFDAATACKMNIMEIHVSCDGLVMAAPLSILPKLKQPFEKSSGECVLAIQDVEVQVPLHQLTVKDNAAKEMDICTKEKSSSRQKMLAVNQSLTQLVHLQLSDAEPLIHLRPAKESEIRCYTNDARKEAFLWNSITKQAVWQSTSSIKNVVRLSCCSDEGEFAAMFSLMDNGVAMMAHKDICHRLHREQCLAVSEVPQIDAAMKQCMLAFKYGHAPYGSGLFGRRLLEACQRIHELQTPHVLLDIVSPGIIHDLQLDPDTTQEQIKEILVEYAATKGASLRANIGGNHKSGRWADFVDSFHKLKRVWHIKLFVMLFACALEGTSPFAAIAGSLATANKTEKITPQVIQVTRLSIVWDHSAWEI